MTFQQTPDLLVYTDRITYQQDDVIGVHISGVGDADVDLVELRQAPDIPDVSAFRPVLSVPSATVSISPQPVVPGSYAYANVGATSAEAVTVECAVWPTLPVCGHRQTIVSMGAAPRENLEVAVVDGRLEVAMAEQEVTSPVNLPAKCWLVVRVGLNNGVLSVHHHPMDPGAPSDLTWSSSTDSVSSFVVDQVLLAAGVRGERAERLLGRPAHDSVFNGKISSPRIGVRVEGEETQTLAWDLGHEPGGAESPDLGSLGCHATFVNGPTRAVTGPRWTGDVSDWRFRPEQYDAVHFHDDDLDDALWPQVHRIQVPATLSSGIYAVRVRQESAPWEELSPCVVVPKRPGASDARVAIMVPTYTYLAYANLVGNGESYDYVEADLAGGPAGSSPFMERLVRLGAFSGSTYDVHSDGSGRTLSTPKRPLLNTRPDWKSARRDAYRHLAADLYVLRWLERLDIDFELLTDHLVTAQGSSVLKHYDVILTGSHPEYTSTEMYRGMQEYLSEGGSLFYLGGNGFYWVTTESTVVDEMVEVRRGFVGTRTWTSEPGEVHHASTGELGGLWRFRGLSPHALLGVGFAAQGADGGGAAYVLNPDLDPGLAFLSEGIDGLIGPNGYDMGAAASDEVDRYDQSLGSPPWGHVVATSQQLSHFYKLTHEDLTMTRENNGGNCQPGVRSDIVWTPQNSGGVVFSVGSIGWIQAMAYDSFNSTAERLTRNALLHVLRVDR